MRRYAAHALALVLASALPAAAQSEEGSESGASSEQSTLGPAVFLSVDGERVFRVSDWIGAPVRLSGGGEDIGEIESLMLGKDGNTVAAIIGVGGFLGIGEKDIAVDINSLTANYVDGQITLDLNATREQIDKAEPVMIEE